MASRHSNSSTALSPVRDCPYCGGAAAGAAFPYASRFAGEDFGYFACSRCDTRYIDPVPSPRVFEQIYAPGDYHDVFYDGDGQSAYRETAEKLAAKLAPNARVFDYGCGSGHFIAALKERGIAASGGEFSAAAAASAAERCGAEVFDLSGPDWQDAGPWDCIHLGDVIEHLPDPGVTLNAILGQLAPGGLLSAEGPLEANRSLVYGAAALFGWAKQQRTAAPPEFPPYHLIFTSAQAQRAFFARLDAPLTELYWEVHETGWPYRRNGAVRNAIAQASIAVSRLPLVGRGFGNRFRALYRREG